MHNKINKACFLNFVSSYFSYYFEIGSHCWQYSIFFHITLKVFLIVGSIATRVSTYRYLIHGQRAQFVRE